jgi:hypothetical protein
VELVTVARQQQPPAGMDVPGERDQAHGEDSGPAVCAVPLRPLRRRQPICETTITSLNPSSISKFETKQQLVDKA